MNTNVVLNDSDIELIQAALQMMETHLAVTGQLILGQSSNKLFDSIVSRAYDRQRGTTKDLREKLAKRGKLIQAA